MKTRSKGPGEGKRYRPEPLRTPGREKRKTREGAFTLRAPLASSQVELRATFSSWPHSGQGLRSGIGGQHMQTFPSCVAVGRARQPTSEQT